MSNSEYMEYKILSKLLNQPLLYKHVLKDKFELHVRRLNELIDKWLNQKNDE